jgi:hypothetical protein
VVGYDFLSDTIFSECRLVEVAANRLNESRLSNVLHEGAIRLKRRRVYTDRNSSPAHAEVHGGLVPLRRLRLLIPSTKQECQRLDEKKSSWKADKLDRRHWLMELLSLVFQLQPDPWTRYRQCLIVQSTVCSIMDMR